MTDRFYPAKMSLGQNLEQGRSNAKLFDNRLEEGTKHASFMGGRTDEGQVGFWVWVKLGPGGHDSWARQNEGRTIAVRRIQGMWWV
jgi:hypothetical protein